MTDDDAGSNLLIRVLAAIGGVTVGVILIGFLIQLFNIGFITSLVIVSVLGVGGVIWRKRKAGGGDP